MLSERAAQGFSTPSYDNRPHLLPGLDFYLQAYFDLQNDRPMGMAVGPIPWSSIVTWAQINDMDADDLHELNYLIRAMERADRDYEQKKEKK